MSYGFLDIASTPGVRATQEANGSGEYWANFHGDRAFDRFTEAEAAFIAARDSLYMATVSETGWPYVQHRGGPAGFIRILDGRRWLSPTFAAIAQYISAGNLATDRPRGADPDGLSPSATPQVYAHVEARDLTADPELAAKLTLPDYKAKVERALIIHLAAFDWNCPQHIVPRFSEAELEPALRHSARGSRRWRRRIRSCAGAGGELSRSADRVSSGRMTEARERRSKPG